MKCASIGVVQLAGTETSDRPGALIVASIVDALTRYLIKLTLAYIVGVRAPGDSRIISCYPSACLLTMTTIRAIESAVIFGLSFRHSHNRLFQGMHYYRSRGFLLARQR